MTASRHYRDKLKELTDTSVHGPIDDSALEWRESSALLKSVSERVRAGGATIKSEIEGNSGEAMVSKFNAISDKLDLDAASMLEGAKALGIAASAAQAAQTAQNGIQLSGPNNQMPTKPEGPTPGAQPTPEQTTALAAYNGGVAQYEANEAAAEQKAKVALETLDTDYGEAAQMMQGIHGEVPDERPDEPPAESPGSPGGPGGPGSPGLPSHQSPGSDRGVRAVGELVPDRDRDGDGDRDQEREDKRQRAQADQERDHDQQREQDQRDRDRDSTLTNRDQIGRPTTNVQGGTDGGTSYQGVNSGSATSGGASGTSTSAGIGGGVAAGAAGAGVGAGMMKGGVGGSAPALRSGSVRAIGAGGPAGAPGSMTRGTTAAGSSARGASAGARGAGTTGAAGAGSPSRSAGAGGRAGAAGAAGAAKGATGRAGAAGAAGAKGSGTGSGKGKGLFRRGSNGSTAGGRSNKKNDENATERDSLVYEQDWLGDDAAGPGVLD